LGFGVWGYGVQGLRFGKLGRYQHGTYYCPNCQPSKARRREQRRILANCARHVPECACIFSRHQDSEQSQDADKLNSGEIVSRRDEVEVKGGNGQKIHKRERTEYVCDKPGAGRAKCREALDALENHQQRLQLRRADLMLCCFGEGKGLPNEAPVLVVHPACD
jgi:hypothetical protein